MGGHHDHGGFRAFGAEAFEGREAVESGQANIEEEHIGRILGCAGQPLFGGRADGDAVAVVAEELAEGPADARLVVEDHHVGHGRSGPVAEGTRAGMLENDGVETGSFHSATGSETRKRVCSPILS